MKNIKFRAWDLENNHMYIPDCIRHGKATELNYDDYIEYDDPIMLYTGLKDKNGIEIYEGDILKFKRDDLNGWKIFPIVWLGFRLTFGPITNVWTLGDAFPADIRQTEVVGNIYENPELLDEIGKNK